MNVVYKKIAGNVIGGIHQIEKLIFNMNVQNVITEYCNDPSTYAVRSL